MAHINKTKNNKGAALVEMAIVLTLLVVLTFAVMEYGWMFFRIQQVSAAAREGVRDAVVPDATVADVINNVNTLMAAWGLDAGSVDISPANIEELEPGEPVTVTVSVPYASVQLLGMPGLFPTPTMLTSRVVMAKEGP